MLWLYSLILLGLRKLDSKDRFYNVCGNIFSTRIGVAMLLLIFFFLSWGGSMLTSYDAPLMGLYRIPFYIVPFLFGYYVFSQDKVLDNFSTKGPYAAVLFVLMVVLYAWRWYPQNYTSGAVQQDWSTMLFATMGSVCLLAVFRCYFDRSSSLTKFMSKRSFGIYVLHYLPLIVLDLNLRRQRQGKQQRLARYALILNLAPVLALYQLYPLLAGLRNGLEQVVHVSAQSGQFGNVNDIALHASPDQSSELPVVRLRPAAYMLLRDLYRVRVNALALEVLPHAVLLLEELLLISRTSVINPLLQL